MAIRSTFYDTTPGEGVKETTWAQSAQSRGPLYGVVGAGDLALTPHATTPYAVNLSAGKFWAHGVWDESTGASLVQSVAPPSGVVWWTLIAVRRDWQPTGGGPTSFVSIPSGGTAVIPDGRESRPGIIDDQPLYLVRWKGGNPQPEQIIDLRCWASNGGVEVVDKLALSYLETPGAEVKLGSSVWRFESKGNGVWGWGEYVTPNLTRWGAPTVTTNSAGYGSVAFSPAFPSAGFMAIPISMPPIGSQQGLVTYRLISISRTGFDFQAFASTGEAIRNTPVVVAYIAEGN